MRAYIQRIERKKRNALHKPRAKDISVRGVSSVGFGHWQYKNDALVNHSHFLPSPGRKYMLYHVF